MLAVLLQPEQISLTQQLPVRLLLFAPLAKGFKSDNFMGFG